MPLLSRGDARAFDRHASEVVRLPSLLLMENAGRAACDIIEHELMRGSVARASVLVVAGVGQNGGDGFVVARHLALRGARVHVIVSDEAESIRGDARTMFDTWVALGGGVSVLSDANGEGASTVLEAELGRANLVVDALFGTGLNRALGGTSLTIVRALQHRDVPVVSLDLPSGLDADTGNVLSAAVRATLTISFVAPKLGLVTSRGAEYAGRVFVADIGVPQTLTRITGTSATLVEEADVRTWLSPRRVSTHKYDAGSVVVFGGAPGTIGAALLTADAALHAGAGLATIASSADTIHKLESRVLEIMTRVVDPVNLAPVIAAILERATSIVVGPGLGRTPFAKQVLAHVFAAAKVPVVVDADALTLVAEDAAVLGSPHGVRIFTPHPGEAARLLGTTTDAVESDRFHAARTLAARFAAVVVLKGAHTITATPDGSVCVNRAGSPALATAGSGDVLAGVIAALAGSLTPERAAMAGVWVHGLVGERFAQRVGDRGLLASEISREIPLVLGELLRGPPETHAWVAGHAPRGRVQI